MSTDWLVDARGGRSATAMVATIWTSEVPMTTLVGHAEEVDQRRHQDEAAADAEQRAEEADADAERDDRDDADIELRALEAHLEAAGRGPSCAGRGGGAAPAGRARALRMARTDSVSISPPIGAEEGDVGERDDEVELADAAEHVEDEHADERADDAGEHQHGRRASCRSSAGASRTAPPRSTRRRSGSPPSPPRRPAECRRR